MFVFRKIWRALFSWNTRFEIRPFALLPTKSQYLRNILEQPNLELIAAEKCVNVGQLFFNLVLIKQLLMQLQQQYNMSRGLFRSWFFKDF